MKKTAVAAGGLYLFNSPMSFGSSEKMEDELEVHIFSKHLQFLDYKTAGEMAVSMGFDGLDLTVRPKGHVLPERVQSDLPKALEDIKAGGSQCKMITTSISSVSNPLDVSIIETAGQLGIDYYRTYWFKYDAENSMNDDLMQYQEEIRQLGLLNSKNDIVGCYQNHAGKNVGASFWEINEILKTVDPKYFGTQYDIRHATAEGGHSWVNGLRLLQEKIKVIVLKDFRWEIVKGKWKAKNVPIGQGMVDFNQYFGLLKKYNLKPPVSLHLEYDLGGAEKGKKDITVDPQVVFDAMQRDLKAVQNLWKQA